MLKFFYNLNRFFYFPLLNWVLPRFNSKIRSRLKFEKEELVASRSFKHDGIVADLAFEVSSEGELEQIRPLLDSALIAGKRVELLYCSESVDHKCKQLYEKYPTQLRILRLPLLSYNIFQLRFSPQRWLTARKFFLCRYDFFPELIFYGEKKHIEFILLWGTLKNFQNKFPHNFFQKYVYRKFDKIVAATNLDRQHFVNDLKIPQEKIEVFDFRPWQILNRLKVKESTLRNKVPHYEMFLNFLTKFPKQKRIILGSFWDHESDVFLGDGLTKVLDQGFIVVIVCHKLDIDYLKSLANLINKVSARPVYSIDENIQCSEVQQMFKHFKEQPGVFMVNLKGILCELYSLFGQAFVGGGHGVSVHSLLEPFLSEAIVYCGPKVHRSTEYDLIRQSSPDRVNIVERLPELFSLINSYQTLEYTSIQDISSFYKKHYPHIVEWLKLDLNIKED